MKSEPKKFFLSVWNCFLLERIFFHSAVIQSLTSEKKSKSDLKLEKQILNRAVVLDDVIVVGVAAVGCGDGGVGMQLLVTMVMRVLC